MLSFQEVILRLQKYWVDQGAILWQPYSEKVGAGTMNPATLLRVLGPEPWNVVYCEPSYRPDDGRYAENPNRMQMHMQMQVILKPDPGDPQELYLKSLEVLGIQRAEHDIRFVEDNWESPALGAWGLGWEVWLDGQEITQYTYFQQAGGIPLEVPAVEITYGLERIVLYLQNKASVWDIQWDAHHTYGEVMRDQEIDYCRYDFDIAHINRLRKMYGLYEKEAVLALESHLIVPALDYILRCSHTFNLLDSRGTIGVTERSIFFKRMRRLTRQVAELYLDRRKTLGYPWIKNSGLAKVKQAQAALMQLPLAQNDVATPRLQGNGTSPFLFEIGVEELPASHLSGALSQLEPLVEESLGELGLSYDSIQIWGTPRRLSVYIPELANRQPDEDKLVKGPPANIAYDQNGTPTKAAIGFARSQDVDVQTLHLRQTEVGEYVYAGQRVTGRTAMDVLSETLPEWISALAFPRSMRWTQQVEAFSRPIRWLVAMLGEKVVPVSCAGLQSGRVTRGPRSTGSQEIALSAASDYKSILGSHGVLVNSKERSAEILQQVNHLAMTIGGHIIDDSKLLTEVTNLVEVPTAILGSFEKRYLTLPQDVLVAVMQKHQRYFPIFDGRERIMAYFITVRNGGSEHTEIVRQGNEAVIRARYADAEYFYNQDCRATLESYRENLKMLVFQENLGSMADKCDRLVKLAPWIGECFALTDNEMDDLVRAAYLSKADLATNLVVEMTSLQGIMGREYARRSGESPAVAQAIFDHYLPRYSGDALPESKPGVVLALADRLDSLTGLFAVELAPTGSADPYGLRRAAASIVHILLSQHKSFSIRDAVQRAADGLPFTMTEKAVTSVVEFVKMRLRVLLRESGNAHDAVEAVLVYQGDDPHRARVSVEQLTSWIAQDGWTTLLRNFARCVRITRNVPQYKVDPSYLTVSSERDLWDAVQKAQGQIKPTDDVTTSLKTFVPLIPMIDRFFNEVMVMVDDMCVRQTRLALLQRIAELTTGVVDLSQLESF